MENKSTIYHPTDKSPGPLAEVNHADCNAPPMSKKKTRY